MTFPNLSTEPATYDGEWQLGDTWVTGSIDLRSARHPELQLYGEPKGLDQEVRQLPERVEIGSPHGRLRRGDDVRLGSTFSQVWFPGRTIAAASWALVGMRLHALDDQCFHRISLQITGLDTLLGVMPILRQQFPEDPFTSDDPTFSVTLNPAAQREWAEGNVTIQAGYQLSFNLSDGYHHQIRFAPNLTLTATEPLSVDNWITDWVEPLRDLATILLRGPQTLSWCRFDHRTGSGVPPDGDTISGQLFAAGITQQPYEARRPPWPHEAPTPLLTFATSDLSPLTLVQRWRELDVPDNVFVRLYRLVISQPELPQRARVLFLVQALESLHTRENEEAQQQAEDAHRRTREQVLEHLKAAEIVKADLDFIKEFLSKQPFTSLDSRLRDLIEVLPDDEKASLESLRESPLGRALADSNHTTPESWLRRLRNDLSHGNRHPTDDELAPWADAAEVLCRHQMMRLLQSTHEDRSPE